MTDTDIGYRSVLPEGWPRPRGFSHAVVATGATTFRVAGQLARQGSEPIPAGLGLGEHWRTW